MADVPGLHPDYGEAIAYVRSCSVSMEQGAGELEALNEPGLRHSLLVGLSGRFAGRVTGETYNLGGKTDLLVRDEGGINVLVGECKVWHGVVALLAALDQLLGYATRRDRGLLLVVFVRIRSLAEVLRRAELAFLGHPEVLAVERDDGDEQAMGLVVRHPQDGALRALVTVYFVAMYSERAEAAGGGVADDAGLDALVGIRQELLDAGGEGLDYRLHVVPLGDEVEPAAEGVMRVIRDTPEGRVVIDATAADPAVARRYAPAGRLVGEGPAGERALMLIHEAMRWHIGVQVRRGTRLEFDRIPPGLAGSVQELEEAQHPIIGLQPSPDWSWPVVLRVRTDRGELDVPISLYEVPAEANYDHTLRGSFHNLSFSMSQRREDDGSVTTDFNWRLHPTDAPVRDRLAALDFLYACSGVGELHWESGIEELPSTKMTLDGDELEGSLLFDRAFFSDITTIERWTDQVIELPTEASAEEVFAIAMAAATIRAGACVALWDGSTWRIETDKAPEMGERGEEEIPMALEAQVFGRVVALGFGATKARFVVSAVEPLPDNPGHVAVTLTPVDDEAKVVRVTELRRPSEAHKGAS